MRTWIMFAGLIALGSCQNHAQDLEQQYSMIDGGKDGVTTPSVLADKCDKAKEVASAYLAQHDQTKYSEWQTTAQTDCMIAGQ